QMKASDVKTSQQRPAMIQTLQWELSHSSDVAWKTPSVRGIRFDFYNDELSKMVVTYDPVATDGLTADDLIEAISAVYGHATKPQGLVTVSNHAVYEEQQKVLARWEDAQ